MIIYRPLTLCVPQFVGGRLDREVLGLSLCSLQVNRALIVIIILLPETIFMLYAYYRF